MAERECIQVEANIDDLDPRLWPFVIDSLLGAGAQDAWVTPILMKKGRPAFTLGALCDTTTVAQVRRVIFTETTTLGLRESVVTKHELDREMDEVEVRGQPIRVKRAFLDGELVNVSVEWDDVSAAARLLGMGAKQLVSEAEAAARS